MIFEKGGAIFLFFFYFRVIEGQEVGQRRKF